MQESAALVLASITLVALLCQWVSWFTRLPAILFLLAIGLVLGPVAGLLDPDQLMGDLMFPMISLSVAVILFEGSLTLNYQEIKELKTVVRRLVTVGALITCVCVAITTRLLFELSWGLSILFGALMVVTGPTVIVPLLRTVRPNAQVSNILRWEGIVIDPIGALLVVVIFEFIITQTQGHALNRSLMLFVEILLVGGLLGAMSGALLGWLLRQHFLPEYLQNLATLSLVLFSFSLANELAHESGLLAVTVMGMWLANTPGIRIREILNFKENLTIMLTSGLFILLAARLDIQQIAGLGGAALILLLVVQIVVRPLAVMASSVGSSLSWRERALLSWIAPRGIVAAAVSALFAIRLEVAGVEGAELLVPLTFIIIIGTVVLQSASARSIARWLGVAEPEPKGFLIVGANPVSRAVGNALKKHEFRVLLTDSSWDNIKAARMAGLETFFGNPVSEYADQNLDLVGIGKVLALSPQRDLNVVASMRYRIEFGQRNVYTVFSDADSSVSEKHQISAEHRGHTLFDGKLSFGKFASLLAKGAEIRSTKLSDEFSFQHYQDTNSDATPLFAINPRGGVDVFVVDGKIKPESGWTILSLFPPAPLEKIEKSELREDPATAKARM